jgi:hypothetical protein
MPIRLNLLAEAQAAEDLRRRDPVKRGIWLAALIVAVLLVVSSFFQLWVATDHSRLSGVEAQIGSHTNAYQQVLENRNKIAEINHKLAALYQLTTNRFLNGTLLNALQQTTVDDVQLLRLRVDMAYTCDAGSRTRTNDDGIVLKGRPASSIENIKLTLEGNDSSPNPGDRLNRFKQVLAAHPYFKERLVKTNAISLKNLSAPQVSPTTGKPCVVFTLECRYPEATR